jgi:hypothetical protein
VGGLRTVKNVFLGKPEGRRETGKSKIKVGGLRTVQKVFLGKPEGRRETGRPKLRLVDCIENDLKSMGVKRWRKKVQDRSVWSVVLQEALVKL